MHNYGSWLMFFAPSREVLVDGRNTLTTVYGICFVVKDGSSETSLPSRNPWELRMCLSLTGSGGQLLRSYPDSPFDVVYGRRFEGQVIILDGDYIYVYILLYTDRY